MKKLPNRVLLIALYMLSGLGLFGDDSDQRSVTPWGKSLGIPPPGFGRGGPGRLTSVFSPEESADMDRQRELILPNDPAFAVEHKVAHLEFQALKQLIDRRVEGVMNADLFPSSANALVTFWRAKDDDPQQPRAMRFLVSYKINGYRVAIKGGITNMNVDSLRIFIGREKEYPVAKEVFIVTPATLTQEPIRVREGATKEERLQAKIIELKGLAAEFREAE
jgi:hypothetical protein